MDKKSITENNKENTITKKDEIEYWPRRDSENYNNQRFSLEERPKHIHNPEQCRIIFQ